MWFGGDPVCCPDCGFAPCSCEGRRGSSWGAGALFKDTSLFWESSLDVDEVLEADEWAWTSCATSTRCFRRCSAPEVRPEGA